MRRISSRYGGLLCCALFPLLVSTAAIASETLVLCVEDADVRPWRTKEGSGLNIELMTMVGKQLGITFVYQAMPWKRCLAQLKANEVNGAIGASFKTERLEIGAYPGGARADPDMRLNFDRYVLMRRNGSGLTWDGKTLHNLEGAIGIQLGYSVGEVLRGMGVAVDESSQRAHDLALKLVAGRLGAAALLDGEIKSLFRNDPKLAAQLEILPVALVEKPYFVILSHALMAAQPELASKIWKKIAEVRNSPAYQKRERSVMEGAAH